MGRHTRQPEEAADEDRVRRPRRLGPIPLLPAVAGAMTLAAVVSAISTKQISLNFAGGSPRREPAPGTLHTQSAPPLSPRGGRAQGDATRRGTPRVSRGTDRDLVTVTFRKVSAWAGGFQGQATITNHGSAPISGWTLEARYGGGTEILNVWNVLVVRTGPTLVVRNPLDRPTIAPGQRVRVSFTADGGGVLPSACTFNGEPCH